MTKKNKFNSSDTPRYIFDTPNASDKLDTHLMHLIHILVYINVENDKMLKVFNLMQLNKYT